MQVVIGAPYDDDDGSGSGSAYIFTRSGQSWSLQQKVTASNAASTDYFGWSVAVDGSTVSHSIDSEVCTLLGIRWSWVLVLLTQLELTLVPRTSSLWPTPRGHRRQCCQPPSLQMECNSADQLQCLEKRCVNRSLPNGPHLSSGRLSLAFRTMTRTQIQTLVRHMCSHNQ